MMMVFSSHVYNGKFWKPDDRCFSWLILNCLVYVKAPKARESMELLFYVENTRSALWVGSNILQSVPSPWRKQTLSRQTCCSLEHGTVWLQKLQGCHWWHSSANQSWHLVQLSAKWVKVALNNADVELMLSSSMLDKIHFWAFFRNYACRFVLWKKKLSNRHGDRPALRLTPLRG